MLETKIPSRKFFRSLQRSNYFPSGRDFLSFSFTNPFEGKLLKMRENKGNKNVKRKERESRSEENDFENPFVTGTAK